MSQINKNDISYLGFNWVEEVKDAIFEYLDNEILKCGNELPENIDELVDKVKNYLGGSNYPEVVGYIDSRSYKAVVSNMKLVELMFRDWGTTLSNELNDRTLFESAHQIGLDLQDYLISNFLSMSDEEYLNYTSSINPQVQVEGLQQAVIHNANEFADTYFETIKPIIPNPLDMSLEQKELLIEGFKEQGLSKRLGLSNKDNFLVPKQESLNSRSTQAKQISDEQEHSSDKERDKNKYDRDKGLSCQ